ncbi:MAG: 2-amino-4-hydroxy-6-hydroxymethyldihydropteridine diphosphokinase [Chthoniobacterales bacterium]
MRAGIALGSNLGDRLANLSAARQQISSLAGTQPPLSASAVYETEPIACGAGAPKFLNAVLELGYAGEPRGLLAQLRQIEANLGRPRRRARNASRTIDLDLLYFGDRQMTGKQLQLPHLRLHERRFVLEPLCEIRPALVLPTHGLSVGALLEKLPAGSPLVRFASEW